MVSKNISDATNDTGEDVHTEVSNKSNGCLLYTSDAADE